MIWFDQSETIGIPASWYCQISYKTLEIHMNRRNAKILRPSHDWVNVSIATHSGSALYDMNFDNCLFNLEANKPMYGTNESCFMIY